MMHIMERRKRGCQAVWAMCGQLLGAFSASAIGIALAQNPQPESIAQEAIAQIMHATEPRDLIRARSAVFEHATMEQIHDLKMSNQHSVALYAAWRELICNSQLAMKHGRLEEAAVQRFMGFVEGRLMMRLPTWWQQTLQSARVLDTLPPLFEAPDWQSTYRSKGVAVLRSPPYICRVGDCESTKVQPERSEFGAPADVAFRSENENLIVTVAGRSVTLPSALFERESFGQLDVLLEGKHCYLALHTERGYAFPLICVSEDGGVKWRTIVWSAACRGSTGYGYQQVTLSADEVTITVFGAEPHALFIERFDKKDGKNVFRFSTWYYDEGVRGMKDRGSGASR